MLKYPLASVMVDANYSSQLRALYKDNPWLEALPDHLDDKELFHAIQGQLPYDTAERELSASERQDCVQSLTRTFIPLGKSGEIARKIASAIREGYVSRNPVKSQWLNTLGQIQDCIRTRDTAFTTFGASNANAYGFCIVGDSGMGKTSAVNHALALFPQVIIHNKYQDQAFPCVQIVWMRLECPHDASVKGLCSQFFMEFDKLTHENTYAKYASGGRATTDQMIPQMALVGERHGLGLLVIDEIQNISEAKSGGAQRMLNFIVQLVNTIGIPVLLVGTPKAIGLLSTDLKTIRRSIGQQGMTLLAPLERNTSDWKSLVKGLWKYQWTTQSTELTDEILDTLYSFSKGNIDATVKLIVETQRLAIRQGRFGQPEIITSDIIRSAAKSDAVKLVLYRLTQERGDYFTDADFEEKPNPRKQDTGTSRNESLEKEEPVSLVNVKRLATKKSGKKNTEFIKKLEEDELFLSSDDAF